MSTFVVTSAIWDSVRRPLDRLRVAIEEAERELDSVRRAYLEAARFATVEPVAAPDPDDARELSRQEARIAALVALGRSNREIACELHVSIHTVKSHVRSILRKRLLRSRWQVGRPLAPAPMRMPEPRR